MNLLSPNLAKVFITNFFAAAAIFSCFTHIFRENKLRENLYFREIQPNDFNKNGPFGPHAAKQLCLFVITFTEGQHL
jgi:hypothetical protein